MNGNRICGWMFGSMPFSMAWEVAMYAGAHTAGTQPGTALIAAGAAPQVIAATALVLWHLDPVNRRTEATAQPTGPTPQQLRRQVAAAGRRRELSR